MMASAAPPPVNGGLALDFGEAKGLETSELGSSGPNTDSPGSHVGYEDYPPANESPYQELSAEEEELPLEVHEKQCFGNDEKSENIESLLQPPAAKKRRKQSNPVRIASTRVLQTVETTDGQDEGPLNLAPPEMADNSSPPTLDAIYRCPHCSAVFDIEDQLRIHVEEEHVQKLLEKQLQHQGIVKTTAVSEGIMSVSTPIKTMDTAVDMSLSYHNIILESKGGMPVKNVPVTSSTISHLPPPLLTPENKEPPVSMASALAASGTFGPPPFLIPLLSQGPSPSQPMSNTGPPIRIFNPEAYCEICNKEFCNKYFLKTHKANKHGIYSMEALAGSPYAGAFLTANMNAAALSMRSLLGTSSAPVTPSTESLSATLAKTPGPLNADAFCEICQKEFCNKYFLRKHRQKIHGIVDQSPTTMTPTTTAHGTNGLTGGTNVSPALTLDSPISNGSSSSVTSVTTTNNFESVCEMCNKDFGSRSQLQNHKYVVHGTPPYISTSVSIPSSLGGPMYTTSNSVSQNEDGFLVQRLDNKPGLGYFTPERLKEIGVINPDAFCELCCKEFCNKYFLRTHKQNKHGVPMPEQGQSKSLSTSPINLVPQVLEKGSNGEDGRQSTTPKMGNGPPSLPGESRNEHEESADLSCNVCGRPFASVYLLKMHKFYSHNIQPCEKEPLESASLSVTAVTTQLHDTKVKEESTQDNAENLVKNEQLDPPGEDLRKLQSMIQELNAPAKENLVSCTICRKDMENKYFLRAHMMNEHGILHSEDNVMDAFIKSTNMSKDQNFLNRYPFLSHPPPTDSETSCDICKKDFGTKYFLHIHKTNAHGIPMDLSMPPVSVGSDLPPSSSSSSVIHSLCPNSESMPAPPNIPSDRPTVITGRNYCEICNKELCNKYFMKTHMLKMHGINIEDRFGIKGAAIIGGVTCDICQKELCSKYFLKVHKQNTHGIFEESPCGKENSRLSTPDKETGLIPGEVTDDNSRYFSHYTEVCPICDRRFKSIKWLKTHMVNDHSDHLRENGITISPQNHEVMSKACPACGKLFSDAVNLQVHMIHHHYASQGGEMQGFGDSVAAKQEATTPEEGDTHDIGSVCSQTTRLGADGLPHKRTGNGTRIYHCSYCSYATRWLSNLYAHEKRHTGLANEGEKKFPCRLCPRAYRYNHSLQRHLLSHRGALSRIPTSESLAVPPLVPPQSNGNGEESGNVQLPQIPRRVRKFRCSKCLMKFRSRKFCQAHIRDVHGSRLRMPLVTATFQKGVKLFKCRRCGFLTRHLNILKQHIRQLHRDVINPSIPSNPAVGLNSTQKSKSTGQNQSLHNDALKTANDQAAASVTTSVITTATTTTSTSAKVAQNGPGVQIPMTYAMPQNPPSAGSFIMQPFLMAQPLVENVGPKAYGTFVPSLVYLPVCQKVSEPVTIAFTLTPA